MFWKPKPTLMFASRAHSTLTHPPGRCQDSLYSSCCCSSVLHRQWYNSQMKWYLLISKLGLSDNEGVVLTRDRNSLRDARQLNTAKNQWYVLETNYDWWVQPDPDDNRRAWGIYFMGQLGRSAVTEASVYKVMSTWPLNNNYTTYTAMLSAKTAFLECYVHYSA